MFEVELIVAALTAGAAAGGKDAASASVRDAYAALRNVVRTRLGDDEEAPGPLVAREVEPGVWEIPSAEQLTASGADHDRDVLAAARRLVELMEWAERTEPTDSTQRTEQMERTAQTDGTGQTERTERTGPSAPKYRVEVRDAKGVQVGDDNTMTINLG